MVHDTPPTCYFILFELTDWATTLPTCHQSIQGRPGHRILLWRREAVPRPHRYPTQKEPFQVWTCQLSCILAVQRTWKYKPWDRANQWIFPREQTMNPQHFTVWANCTRKRRTKDNHGVLLQAGAWQFENQQLHWRNDKNWQNPWYTEVAIAFVWSHTIQKENYSWTNVIPMDPSMKKWSVRNSFMSSCLGEEAHDFNTPFASHNDMRSQRVMGIFFANLRWLMVMIPLSRLNTLPQAGTEKNIFPGGILTSPRWNPLTSTLKLNVSLCIDHVPVAVVFICTYAPTPKGCNGRIEHNIRAYIRSMISNWGNTIIYE